mgnify:FL=1
MYQFDRKEYEKRMEWYQDARFGMFIHWDYILSLQEASGYEV